MKIHNNFTNIIKQDRIQAKRREKANDELNATSKSTLQGEDKVASIKKAVENKNYRINLQGTAEKMALNLLNL